MHSAPPIDDDLINELAEQATVGDDVDEVIARRGKRGRPRSAAAPSTVEPVRLDPQPTERLARRAEDDGFLVSEVISAALRRHHLRAS